jgi:hypothetical protein
MTDIKRTRYFDQQLLVLRDFTDEQSYHVEMRRRHNRLLHTSGVADGLDVTMTGANEVTVKAGMALDNQGREVALDADTIIDLNGATSSTKSSVLVIISYEESETDEAASAANQNTRIKEAGRVAVFKEEIGKAPDSAAVQLARVTFNSKGEVDKVDLSMRKQAGASSFDKPDAAFTVRSLRLSIPGSSNAAQWPSLTASGMNQMAISGSLVAQGTIATSSDLTANNATIANALNVNRELSANSATIKSTLSVTGDLTVGAAGAPSKLQVAGPIAPSVGNSASAGIQFPSNPGGGSGDEAYIRYFATGGETTRLQIGVGNDPDDSLGLVQAGAERLIITRGNIGIGTSDPKCPLQVEGEMHSAGYSFGDRTSAANYVEAPGNGERWVWYAQDKAARLWSGADKISVTGEKVTIEKSLQVKGTTQLGPLQVNGPIQAGAMQVDGTIKSQMWNATQIFNSRQGPRDGTRAEIMNAEFSTKGGTLLIFAAGAGRANLSGVIGMTIWIDSTEIGRAICWANDPQKHQAFVANAIVPAAIPAGKHTLWLRTIGDNTIVDFNDYFNVTVFEMPW